MRRTSPERKQAELELRKQEATVAIWTAFEVLAGALATLGVWGLAAATAHYTEIPWLRNWLDWPLLLTAGLVTAYGCIRLVGALRLKANASGEGKQRRSLIHEASEGRDRGT